MNAPNNIARLVYVVEDDHGTTITASRDKTEAREHGEDVQEFNPDTMFYLNTYTLH